MDKKKEKKQYVAINLVYLFYYAAYTSYFSFLTVFLAGYGYSTSKIGIVFTCTSLINLVSQPVLGYISDTKIPIKKIVMISMMITIPGGFLLSPTVSIFPVAIASILLIAFFDFALIGLLDTWTNLGKQKNKYINYSVVRGMGSLSSAVAALLIGGALERFGMHTMFLLHAAFMLIALVFCGQFINIPCQAKGNVNREEKSTMFRSLIQLWENKSYRYFLIAIFLINMGWRIIVTYLPTMLIGFGGSGKHQGIAMAVMTIGIAPVMFIYPKLLKRFGVNKMLLVGALLTVIRILSISLGTNLWSMVWIQLGEAISFGLFQPSTIEYISAITPLKQRALAVSTATAVQMALCGTAGNYIAGHMLERWNFGSTYLMFGAIAFVGFVLLVFSMAKSNKSSNVMRNE